VNTINIQFDTNLSIVACIGNNSALENGLIRKYSEKLMNHYTDY